MISSRANYSLVLNSRGQVFGFGFNHHGQLGTGDKKNREIPTLNEMLGTHKIISMVAAENHSIFITSQIQVIKCGGEPSRSLKILKNQEFLTVTGGRNSRIAMPSIPGKVIAISMGMGDFFLILNSLSQVFSFGANGSGCMGVGDKEPRKNPTRIGVTDIVALSAGESHSLFLNSKGQVFSCGSNGAGQLGLGDHRERLSPVLIDTSPLGEMRAISAGRDFSLILNADGQVFSFGSNNIRQLGLGDNKDRNLPTLIKGTGIDATNQIGQVVAITVGNYHSSIMNTQGQVFSFGYNTFGQLGLGDNISRNIPTLVMNIFD
jgi:alpha-tubulin suppressor-like RCC1 family protein